MPKESSLPYDENLFRAVINESPDPIYAKNARYQYVMFNPAFIKMLRLPAGTDITHKTFREVVEGHFLATADDERRKELETLIGAVETEDRKILADKDQHAQGCMHEWPEVLGHQSQIVWQTRKRRLPQDHILGISRNIYDIRRVAHALLDKVPLGFCLKNEDLEIVWCNRDHAMRHGVDDPEKLVGKTDYDLWPETDYNKETPEYYRRKDKRVLSIGKRFGQNPADTKLKEALKEFTEYTELERRKHDGTVRESTLVKTKWPERINGKWHVALVYTDITGALNQVGEYHRFTVHSIKNQFSAIDSAQLELEEFLKDGDPKRVREALSSIKRGSDSFAFFTVHLLKFLRGKIQPALIPYREVFDLVNTRVDWTRGVEKKILDVEFCDRQRDTSDVTVELDKEYLTAVIMELLRNAATAIRDRKRLAITDGATDDRGKVVVTLDIRKPDPSPLLHLCITVTDNGISSISREARKEFRKKWDAAHKAGTEGPHQVQSHFGLTFVHATIHRHTGRLDLSHRIGRTIVQILLPIAKNNPLKKI